MNFGTRLTVDDKMRSLFHLDPVLPAQYQNTFQGKFPVVPEKTLMLAVLEDAVTCFQKYALAGSGKPKQMFREAEDWFLEKDSRWLFSFEQICAALGWDPGYIRHGLTKEKEKLLARTPERKHQPTDKTAKKKYKGRKVRLAA